MTYQWIKLLHIASAVGFVAVHGASITLIYAARRERDRRRLQALLDLSGRTASAMYLTLAGIVGSGVGMASIRTNLFAERWYWASLVVLTVTSVLMVAVAKPFTMRLRTACELRPSGIPRISDEELADLVRSPRAHAIATIGFAGLAILLYLMVFQPSLGAGGARPAPVTTTTTTAGGSNGDTTTSTLSGEAALLARGREVFEVTVGCSNCHGLDGFGSAFGPPIAGREREDIEDALRFAPPMADIRLSDEDLDAVAFYVRRLAG
ncbi:MAG TPA: cytochrome c [Acidimicrobiia bacterium]|nr:cytochrome c [Acidimicrobiia bacterium]